ncbi:MAG: PAS domain S-box protein [Thermodesulfobacteriota bacterium]
MDLKNFEAVFQSTADGMAITDLEGRFVGVNANICEALGYSREELLQMHAIDLKPLSIRDEFAQHFELLKERGVLSLQTTYLKKDGTPIPIGLTASVVQLEGQSVVLVVVSDITVQREISKSLRNHNEQLITLINTSPDIICFKDGEGRWLLANEADLELFQLSGVDYNGKTDAELAPFSDFYREAFLTCMDSDEEAWEKGALARGEEVIPMPDGGEKVFEVVKVPLFEEDGTRKGLVVLGHDITERRRTEEMLRREIAARQQASEVLEQKSQELEEANVALRVLLKQQKNSAEELQQRVLTHYEKMVFPYLDLLRFTLEGDKGKEYLDIIRRHLQEISSSFTQKLSNPNLGLTKREILIADLVRQGNSTKEIAGLLSLRSASVEAYRNKIRKKLNINNKKVRLKDYLAEAFTSD